MKWANNSVNFLYNENKYFNIKKTKIINKIATNMKKKTTFIQNKIIKIIKKKKNTTNTI